MSMPPNELFPPPTTPAVPLVADVTPTLVPVPPNKRHRGRRRHAASGGRLLAFGLSASAFLIGVRALAAHPPTWTTTAQTASGDAATTVVPATTATTLSGAPRLAGKPTSPVPASAAPTSTAPPAPAATAPAAQAPSATAPAATAPLATQPPATNPPATNPPATQPPAPPTTAPAPPTTAPAPAPPPPTAPACTGSKCP